MTYKLPKTKRGAARQYRAMINRAREAMQGGLEFGMDWPTFRSWFPEAYAHIQAMRAVYPSLPE